VTIPSADDHAYGSELLKTYLWPDGNIEFRPGGPGFVTSKGALGMKFPWFLGVKGKLGVTGHRLDGAAEPVQFVTNGAYDDSDFVASYLIFPTPGCWQVTAQVDGREDARITFVTRIVKIGEGPARYDPRP
jgi:hypothetical protein